MSKPPFILYRATLISVFAGMASSCEVAKVGEGHYVVRARDTQANSQQVASQAKKSPPPQTSQTVVKNASVKSSPEPATSFVGLGYISDPALRGAAYDGTIAGRRDFENNKSCDPSRYDSYLKAQRRFNNEEISYFHRGYMALYRGTKERAQNRAKSASPW